MPPPSIALPGRNYLAIVNPWVVSIPSCPTLNWLIKQTLFKYPLCARNCTSVNVVLWNFTPLCSLFLIRMRYCGFWDVPCFFLHPPAPPPSSAQIVPMTWNTLSLIKLADSYPELKSQLKPAQVPQGDLSAFSAVPCAELWVYHPFIIFSWVCVLELFACVSLPWNRGTLRAGTVSVPFCILNKVLIGIKFCLWVNGMMNSWLYGRKEKNNMWVKINK